MKKEAKIALGIIVPIVVLGGTYLILRKRAKNKGCSKSKFGSKIFGVMQCSDVGEEEDIDRGEEAQEENNSGGGASSGGASSGAIALTPFKNKLEGDSFRLWVNYKHNDYAKKIDLDSRGSYNNAYIGKAWKKHGQEYLKANPLRMVRALMGANIVYKNNEIVAKFGNGNKIKFWSNGRYHIYDSAGKTIQKGNYYSGGRDLVATELKNKGRTSTNSSVWKNLPKAIA